jgi:SOS-response transcriptional repressors (RecA-mediated autopeptidases)
VKTLTHRGATIVLEPANPADRAISVGPGDDFSIRDVVCGVYRAFCEEADPVPPALSVAD